MADEKIVGAYVEISTKGIEKVGPQIERMKTDIERKLPTQDDEGHFGKFLFGRRGAEGVQHSTAKAFGHLGKLFLGGGVFAIGVGLAVKLGESLLSTALGLEKTAQAAEHAAKRMEEYKESIVSADKAAIAAAKGPAPIQASDVLNTTSPLEALRKRLEAREAKEQEFRQQAAEARTTAGKASLSADELKQIKDSLGDQHTLDEEKQAREDVLRKRRENAAQRAMQADKQAEELRQQNISDLGAFFSGHGQSGLAGAADIGRSILGAGGKAFGQAGAGIFRGGATLRDTLADLQNSIAKPGRKLSDLSGAELQAHARDLIARRDQLQNEKLFAHRPMGGGVGTLESARDAIQQALLEPNGIDKELLAVEKEQRDLQKVIAAKLGGGGQAGAVVAANR